MIVELHSVKFLQVSFLLHCFTLRKEKGIAAQGYILKNVVCIFFFFFAFPSDPKIHHE